jgi:hypothetical protein
MFLVVEDQAVVLVKSGVEVISRIARQFRTHYFVCHDEKVELFREGGNLLQLSTGKNFPNRVMRGVNDNHFGTGGNGGPARIRSTCHLK